MSAVDDIPTIESAVEDEEAEAAVRARNLKQRAAASLTPRVSNRTRVESIVAETQINNEFSTVLPIEQSKPQGRLQRLWSKVVSVGKKVFLSPMRLFRRKRKG